MKTFQCFFFFKWAFFFSHSFQIIWNLSTNFFFSLAKIKKKTLKRKAGEYKSLSSVSNGINSLFSNYDDKGHSSSVHLYFQCKTILSVVLSNQWCNSAVRMESSTAFPSRRSYYRFGVFLLSVWKLLNKQGFEAFQPCIAESKAKVQWR